MKPVLLVKELNPGDTGKFNGFILRVYDDPRREEVILRYIGDGIYSLVTMKNEYISNPSESEVADKLARGHYLADPLDTLCQAVA